MQMTIVKGRIEGDTDHINEFIKTCNKTGDKFFYNIEDFKYSFIDKNKLEFEMLLNQLFYRSFTRNGEYKIDHDLNPNSKGTDIITFILNNKSIKIEIITYCVDALTSEYFYADYRSTQCDTYDFWEFYLSNYKDDLKSLYDLLNEKDIKKLKKIYDVDIKNYNEAIKQNNFILQDNPHIKIEKNTERFIFEQLWTTK